MSRSQRSKAEDRGCTRNRTRTSKTGFLSFCRWRNILAHIPPLLVNVGEKVQAWRQEVMETCPWGAWTSLWSNNNNNNNNEIVDLQRPLVRRRRNCRTSRTLSARQKLPLSMIVRLMPSVGVQDVTYLFPAEVALGWCEGEVSRSRARPRLIAS